jgi:hypothetical protein
LFSIQRNTQKVLISVLGNKAMLTIKDVTQFFGYPPQHPDFDRYLTSCGLSERPVFEGNAYVSIDNPREGFTLVFDVKHGYEEHWGPAKEGGEMIFKKLQLYSVSHSRDKAYRRYAGDLPHGLHFECTPAEAKALLGKPDFEAPPESHSILLMWNNKDGHDLSIVFLSDERGIRFIYVNALRKVPVEWN